MSSEGRGASPTPTPTEGRRPDAKMLSSLLPAASVVPFSYGPPRLCLPCPRRQLGVQQGAWEPPAGRPCTQGPVWQEGGSLQALGSGVCGGQFGMSRKGSRVREELPDVSAALGCLRTGRAWPRPLGLPLADESGSPGAVTHKL